MTTLTLPDLTGVRALTLHRPWPTLITHGPKRIENRNWAPFRGTRRIILHAGKQWDPAGVERLRELGYGGDIAGSAVVGVADVDSWCDASPRGRPCTCGPWAIPGAIHWRLGTVWVLAQPVPARGRQALWDPGLDLLRDIHTARVAAVHRSPS